MWWSEIWTSKVEEVVLNAEKREARLDCTALVDDQQLTLKAHGESMFEDYGKWPHWECRRMPEGEFRLFKTYIWCCWRWRWVNHCTLVQSEGCEVGVDQAWRDLIFTSQARQKIQMSGSAAVPVPAAWDRLSMSCYCPWTPVETPRQVSQS